MEHYYTKQPHSASQIKDVQFLIRDMEFTFLTGAGVFSMNKVDFGTEQLIRGLLDDIETPPDAILDLGCGYGALGIVLARVFPGTMVHMTDVNERALALCRDNTIRNRVKNALVYESDSFDSIRLHFDVIASNPPLRAGKQVVYKLFKQAREHLRGQGTLYCVIQNKHGAESARRELQEIYGNCACIRKKAGYRVLKSQKAIP